ncbi:ribonuclease D [Marinicella litoralis]|uniref:ribonuclease D n=1 Tax=Marinicella litoralis TaxID=644220 RepID=UPI0015D47091|nr:HRDC domain-containing protein [Marinicella litoralis]
MANINNVNKRFFMDKILSNFIWVDDTDAAFNLAALIDQGADYAIDTEFERSRTFYLNPALLQINCDGLVYLVDIAIPDIANIVMKPIQGLVLHSGSEDLELWHQVTQQKPQRVFDTQVAAALSGYSLHTSYLNLVNELMGVELDKAMSRSDWLARPLSDAQLQYAVEDIIYLDEFKMQLTEKMNQRGLNDLFSVLMQQMIDNIDHDIHSEKLFQKMVKSERLNHEESKKLWLILNWRDQLAKSRNKPRNWILNPKQIVEVIRKVKTYSDLFHLGLHPNFVKLNGEKLIQVMFDQANGALQNLPAKIKLSSQQGAHLSEMKLRLSEVAARFDIEPSVIINVQALKKLAFEGGDLNDLPTWQALI